MLVKLLFLNYKQFYRRDIVFITLNFSFEYVFIFIIFRDLILVYFCYWYSFERCIFRIIEIILIIRSLGIDKFIFFMD